MDTEITDADRLGKRKSDNWPPGVTIQKVIICVSKGLTGKGSREHMERKSGALLEKGSREAGRVGGQREASVKVGETAGFWGDRKDLL